MDGKPDAFGAMRRGEKLRSWPARIGVAALNLITPGLGLLRIGRGRAGLVALVLPSLVIGGLAFLGSVAPATGFVVFAIIAGLLIVGFVILYGATVTMTWRGSRMIREVRWWSRWYALIGGWLAAWLVLNGVAALMRQRVYKTYYAPTVSMAPTIARNDHFWSTCAGGSRFGAAT